MATALQQQLAAIAEKSTHQLDLKAQRTQHSQSLLFEPKDAANQTFDTLYDIALDGFEELCRLDKRFLAYSTNLFSEQSKSEDRTQMRASENEELDQVINAFLGLVSGRLLLKPAQKALEWLVRRFKIQDYNTEQLLLAFLPYHENDIFTTVLAILPKSRQLSPPFKFLQPYVKSLSVPPRHAIVYSAINNSGFFSLLNRFVLDACKMGNQSATLLGFWASITAQSISGQLDSTQVGRPSIRRQREEEVLLRTLPALQEAFRLGTVHELYLGACMITVILATKLDLNEKVLARLASAVVGSWSDVTINDGLACLSVLARARGSSGLPPKIAGKVLRLSVLHQRLENLSVKYDVGELFVTLAIARLEADGSENVVDALELFQGCLRLESIKSTSKEVILVHLIAKFLELEDKGANSQLAYKLKQVISWASRSQGLHQLLLNALRAGKFELQILQARLGQALLLESSANATPGSDDESVREVMDVDEAFDSSRLEAALAGLTDLPSFLGPDTTQPYREIRSLFIHAISAKVDLGPFIDQFKSDISPGRGLSRSISFLLRISVDASPVTVIQAALRLIRRSMQELKQELQVVLVFCFMLLKHEHQTIRTSAANLITESISIIRAASKAKKMAAFDHFEGDQVYGPSSGAARWIKMTDFFDILIEAVQPVLEECVVDRSTISQTLASCIDGDDDDLEIKSTVRSSLFATIANHAAACPVLRVRLNLFSFTRSISKAASSGRKQVLVPMVKSWCSTADTERLSASDEEDFDVAEVDTAHINCLSAGSEDEISLLQSMISDEHGYSTAIQEVAKDRFISLWSSIAAKHQSRMARELLPIGPAVRTANGNASLDLIRKLRLSADTLVSLLQEIHQAASPSDGQPQTKRRRTSGSKTREQELDAESLNNLVRQMTTIVELVESSKPERHPELLKMLFLILADIQHVKTQLGSEMVYLQQMTIGCILSLVNTMKATRASKVDRSALRVDLIVDCMRSTSNTQIHNSALLLIASLAGWASDLVLHNVMPIFTFMSNNTLKQGDDYSAHIIDQTVSQIIPPLATSLRRKNQDLVTGAAELLLSFVAAFEHIPMHRRLQLFRQLVEALGPSEALAPVIAMLFQRYPSDERVPGFCVDLAVCFSTSIQLKALVQYMDLVADVLQPRRTVSQSIFSFDQGTSDEGEMIAGGLMSLLGEFLSEAKFTENVRSSIAQENNESDVLQQNATALIDRSIAFSKTIEANKTLHQSSKIVSVAVLDLLPTQHFVASIIPLLENPDEAIGTGVLRALERRAQTAKGNDAQARDSLLQILPVLGKLLKDSSILTVKYATIAAIDKIVEKYGRKDLTSAVVAAKTIASAGLRQEEINLAMVSLYSLATMVDVLRDEMVSLLPGIVKETIEIAERSCTEHSQPRLFIAASALLCAVVDHLPWTVGSSSVSKILSACVQAADKLDIAASTRKARADLTALLVSKLDFRLLAEAISQSIGSSLALSVEASSEILNVIEKVVDSATKSKISRQASQLLSDLRRFFDLREVFGEAENADLLAKLQQLDRQRDAILMKCVMKLNDSTFRPFFVGLVDWAAGLASETEGNALDSRLISFYGFLATFFDTLKSLVTSYASYILQPTADLLARLSPTKKSHAPLLASSLQALTNTFKHDQDDFWQSPSHFDTILPPLITLLRQSKSIAKDDTIDIIGTITSLGAAASSPDRLKALNTELLKMMRAKETHARLAAVETERRLTEALGEDWLALLPEMLPAISELQEDEDEGVERETLGWIKEIEGVLGESLEGMLR